MSAKSRYTKESSTELPLENTETTSSTSTSTSRKRATSIVQDEPSRRRRSSLSVSPKSPKRSRMSQSSERDEIPPEAFSSDNEYNEGDYEDSPNFSPMNVDDGTSNTQKS